MIYMYKHKKFLYEIFLINIIVLFRSTNFRCIPEIITFICINVSSNKLDSDPTKQIDKIR